MSMVEDWCCGQSSSSSFVVVAVVVVAVPWKVEKSCGRSGSRKNKDLGRKRKSKNLDDDTIWRLSGRRRMLENQLARRRTMA